MSYEKIETAAKAFAVAPDNNCLNQFFLLKEEVKKAAYTVNADNAKAVQGFGEAVRKICLKAGLSQAIATHFDDHARKMVDLVDIPF